MRLNIEVRGSVDAGNRSGGQTRKSPLNVLDARCVDLEVAMSRWPENDHELVVACLGSSSTAARGPYDWIADLERRPENRDFRFRRFAEGGDLAYNGAQRLPKLLVTKPDVVLIMPGGNDVMASMPQQSAYYRVMVNSRSAFRARRPSNGSARS
jgi:hypothetical protein